MISQERLRQLVDYNPTTGIMIWRLPRRKYTPGVEIGRIVKGYRNVFIEGRTYYVHVLAVLYMTGEYPPYDVDHINTIKDDNRWLNIRLATRSQNKANMTMQVNNKLAIKGVSWDKRSKMYAWNVKCGTKRMRGLSDCPADAHFSYVIAADKMFKEFAFVPESETLNIDPDNQIGNGD